MKSYNNTLPIVETSTLSQAIDRIVLSCNHRVNPKRQHSIFRIMPSGRIATIYDGGTLAEIRLERNKKVCKECSDKIDKLIEIQ